MGSLKGQILAQRSPLLIVRSSPEAEIACLKSGLTFAEMLRPFAHLRNLNVPMRTAGDHPPYRLHSLPMRVVHWSVLAPCAAVKSADDELALHVSQVSEACGAAEEWAQAKEVRALVQTRYEDPTPWFTDYQHEFSQTLHFGEHEALDHPVGCLLVLPSTVEDPVRAFLALEADKATLPALLADGLADPTLLKHFVVLHDMQEGPAERAEQVLQELRVAFGHSSCQLVCINSLDADGSRAKPPPDVWSSMLDPDWMVQAANHPRRPGAAEAFYRSKHGVGGCLSSADTLGLEALIRDLTTKALLPYLESRVCSLNHQVTATRRGLKNQLKSLWWRKERKEGEDSHEGGPAYTFDSPEVQLRVLADLAFILQDYELALAHYRLAAADFKADKAWKRYAAVNEAIGVTLFMLDGPRREMEVGMETAFQTYSRCAQSSPAQSRQLLLRYATRSMLLLASMHRAHGMFREATAPLMRASYEEVPLRAALLLEQAALGYLQAQPPLMRKFGFYMVLAGHRYNHANQRWHAIRSYASVLELYRDHSWLHVEEHLHFALGRQVAYVGDLSRAMHFFVKLLGACSHRPATLQATYLREFLYVAQCLVEQNSKRLAESVQSEDLPLPPDSELATAEAPPSITAADTVPCMDLPLPHIDLSTIYVHFQDHRSNASASAQHVPEPEWTVLERPLLPAMSEAPTWLDNPSSTKLKDVKESTNNCVSGESILVDVCISNPLQVPIEVTEVALVCEHVSLQGATTISSTKCGIRRGDAHSEADTIRPESPTAPKSHGHDLSTAKLPMEAMEVRKQSAELKPGESTLLQLMVRPMMAGTLRITAVEWTLCGLARGRRELLGRNSAREPSAQKHAPAVPPHKRLLFLVVPPLPRLEASLEGLPAVMYEGEVRECALHLVNVAARPLCSLKLNCTTPEVLCGKCPEPGPVSATQDSSHVQEGLSGQTSAPTNTGTTNANQGSTSTGTAAPGNQRFSRAGSSDARAGVFVFPSSVALEGGGKWDAAVADQSPESGHMRWPVWVRACEPGTMKLRMVVYYEPTSRPGDRKVKQDIAYRVLRMDAAVQVVPSLRITAKATPSSNSLDQHLLRVRVQSLHPSDTFFLRSISIVSPLERGVGAAPVKLSLSPLGGTPGPLESTSKQRGLAFHALEEIDLLFHVHQRSSEDVTKSTRLFLESGGAGVMHDPPILNHWAVQQYHHRLSSAQSRASRPSAGVSKFSHVGCENANHHMDLMLEWVTGDGASSVQPHVIPSKSKCNGVHYMSKCPLENAAVVRCKLAGPHNVSHDFNVVATCMVPMQLRVSNGTDKLVKVQVQTPPSKERTSEKIGANGDGAEDASAPVDIMPSKQSFQGSSVTCSEAYIWCGNTNIFLHLQPGETKTLSLGLAVLAPGTFILPNWWLAWETTTGTKDERGGMKVENLDSPSALKCAENGAQFLLNVSGLNIESTAG